MIEDATRYRSSETPAEHGGENRPDSDTEALHQPGPEPLVENSPAPSGSFTVPPLIVAAPPFSLAELARRFGEMVWLEERLFEVVGWWSTFEPDDSLAVLFAELSRHHGWHAELWRTALPGADGLASTDQIGPPHQGWVKFFQALVAMDDKAAGADRVAVLALVLDPWIRIRNEQLTAAFNPPSDRAIARIQRFVLIDHEDDHSELMAALTRLPNGPTSPVPDQLFPLIGENH